MATAALASAMALPSASWAATDINVDAQVVNELSMSVTAPQEMVLGPNTPGSSSSLVDVQSTLPAWSVTLADGSLTTPGFMDRVNCTTGVATTGSLTNPLGWSVFAGNNGNVSASPAVVKAGSLNSNFTVNYSQTLDAADAVAVGECYRSVLTFVAS